MKAQGKRRCRMLSPDVFADDDRDSNDSFENFNATPCRRRSEAIVQSEENSFDFATGNDQVTVIENRPDATCLHEEQNEDELDSEETINRLLESSSEEEDERTDDENTNDALTNLLKSFGPRETSEEKEEMEANVSVDVFANDEEPAGARPESEEVEMENGETVTLPVELPDADRKEMEPPPKKRRPNPPGPSTSLGADGPVGMVCSDGGEYWQHQAKTIEVHGEIYEINSFGDYMRMKMAKLNYQVNKNKSKPFEKVSEILKGYSVFVNGYTEPPALVIRDLMMAHGGEYHCYYMHGKTSYVIATSIATAKINRIREKEIFIKADWITESIAAGKPLDYRDFLIYEKGAQEKGRMAQFLNPSDQPSTSTSSSNNFLDARNPNFIRDYYARSRLHLISTLAQDMKDFVANLKIEAKLTEKCFPEEELRLLKGNSDDKLPTENIVFHVDLDCFFVSVALRDREDLRDKEVAITHSKGTISNSMSEVASCSYAARRCGVKNGILVRDALQKCPNLTLLPYQFDDYVNVSKQIYQILASYTLELRAVSCDEMYINVGNLCKEYGIHDPTKLAEHIRKVIRTETRCPASVGIGSTSLLARLATRHAKPDGVYWVTEEKKGEFMKEEKIRDLPGVGYQMMDRLIACLGDISKCGQLQLRAERELTPVFGPKLALKIFKQCRGTEEDPEDFWKTHLRKSVSCDINYGIRFTKKEELLQLMRAIGAELERKLTDCKMIAGSITLKLMVRAANAPQQTAKFMGHGICDTFTKTCNLTVATIKADVIYTESMKLYAKVSPKLEDLRGVGVTCGKLKNTNRKNALNAVQQMFGLSKKETEVKKTKSNEGTSRQENDEEEEDMRKKVEQSLPSTSSLPTQKSRDVTHPVDIPLGKGVTVPSITTTSVLQLRRTLRSVQKAEERADPLIDRLGSILILEPSKETVCEIHSELRSMIRAGRLSSYEGVIRKLEVLTSDSQRSHVDWYSAFHIILQHLKEESKEVIGFPIDSTISRVPKRVESSPEDKEAEPESRRRVPCEITVFESTKSL